MNITKIFWQIIHYPLNNTTYDTNKVKNYGKAFYPRCKKNKGTM